MGSLTPYDRFSRRTWRVDLQNAALGLRENAYYGHDWALAHHLGRSAPGVINGIVQHGWTPTAHAHMATSGAVELGLRLYPWTEDQATILRRHGAPRVQPVGAPFLYLARDPVPTPHGSAGSLYYPTHTWERQTTPRPPSPARLRWLEDHLGTERTVVLYYRDYAFAPLRSAYARAGFRVIRHGSHKTDPHHLVRQLDTLRRHAEVYADRITTALLYAAHLGKQVVLVPGESDQPAGLSELTGRLHDGLEGREATELGGQLLGADLLLSPQELARTIDWTPEGQARLGRLARTGALARGRRRLRAWMGGSRR